MDVDQLQPKSLDLSQDSVQGSLILEGTVEDSLDSKLADREIQPLELRRERLAQSPANSNLVFWNHGTSLFGSRLTILSARPIGGRHPLWVTVIPAVATRRIEFTLTRRRQRSPCVVGMCKRVRMNYSSSFTLYRVMSVHPWIDS